MQWFAELCVIAPPGVTFSNDAIVFQMGVEARRRDFPEVSPFF